MTDGERARLKDAKSIFDQASIRTSPQRTNVESIEHMLYTYISLTIGWVLEERPYWDALEEHIKRLKSMGVEPVLSEMHRPNRN